MYFVRTHLNYDDFKNSLLGDATSHRRRVKIFLKHFEKFFSCVYFHKLRWFFNFLLNTKLLNTKLGVKIFRKSLLCDVPQNHWLGKLIYSRKIIIFFVKSFLVVLLLEHKKEIAYILIRLNNALMNDDFVVNSLEILWRQESNTHTHAKNFSMSQVISLFSRQCGRVIAHDRIVREKLLEREKERCKKRSKIFIASHIHAIASLSGDKMLHFSHVHWR